MILIVADEDLGGGMNAFVNAAGALIIIQDGRKPIDMQVYVYLTPEQRVKLCDMLISGKVASLS